MQRMTISGVLVIVVTLEVHAADLSELFPPREMNDVSSLKLDVSPAKLKPSTLQRGRSLQVLKLSYNSFEWAGEQWRHQAIVVLPDRKDVRYRGAAVIIAGGGPPFQKMAEAAALMGIPALMIQSGNPGPHYGYPQEGELMGFAEQKFLKTGDPNWIGYAWLGKVIVRAVTAATAIPEMQAERFVVTGGSKRGAASWIAAGADERIIGAFPMSWNAGNFRAFLQLKARRWGLDYQPRKNSDTVAPAFVTTREQIARAQHARGQVYRRYTDPFEFRDRLKDKQILYAVGTNDPLFPVAADTVFLPYLSPTVRVLLVPNAGHTVNTPRHLTAWRMWLAHCFAGRDVPRIDVTAERNGERAVITATVRSRTTIKSARLWSTRDERGAYLKVNWRSHRLERIAPGKYRATLTVPAHAHVGYFIELTDDDPQSVPGVVTTGFQEFVPVLSGDRTGGSHERIP